MPTMEFWLGRSRARMFTDDQVSPAPSGPRTATVLGAGAWGTAIAIALSDAGVPTRLYARRAGHVRAMQKARENVERLPGRPFPPQLSVTNSLEDAVSDADTLFLVVTSDNVVEVTEQMSALARPGTAFVVCAKGLAPGGGLLTDAVGRIWTDGPVLFLSGPSFAHEVAQGMRTIVALAGPIEAARRIAGAYSNDRFVMAPSADLSGVQVAGVFKNVAAILCGASDGLGAGANTRAALMSEAIREASDLVVALGGDQATLLGPAGFGDFALSCTDAQSRNYSLGHDIATGHEGDGATHEGAANVTALLDLAAEAGVSAPLVAAVARLLSGASDAAEAVEAAFVHRLAKAKTAVPVA